MEQIIIQHNRKLHLKNLLFSALGLAYLSFLLYKHFTGQEELGTIFLILVAIFEVFNFYMFTISLRKMLKSTPAFVINDTGIEDNCSIAELGQIPWHAITGAKITTHSKRKHLAVFIDPKHNLENASRFKEELITSLVKKHGSPLVIDAKLIDYEIQQLLELINDKTDYQDTDES